MHDTLFTLRSVRVCTISLPSPFSEALFVCACSRYRPTRQPRVHVCILCSHTHTHMQPPRPNPYCYRRGRGRKERDQEDPSVLRPRPAGVRPSSLRAQEVRRQERALSLPEVLPLKRFAGCCCCCVAVGHTHTRTALYVLSWGSRRCAHGGGNGGLARWRRWARFSGEAWLRWRCTELSIGGRAT